MIHYIFICTQNCLIFCLCSRAVKAGMQKPLSTERCCQPTSDSGYEEPTSSAPHPRTTRLSLGSSGEEMIPGDLKSSNLILLAALSRDRSQLWIISICFSLDNQSSVKLCLCEPPHLAEIMNPHVQVQQFRKWVRNFFFSKWQFFEAKLFQSPSAVHASWAMQLCITSLFLQWVRSKLHFLWHTVISPSSENGDAPVTGMAGNPPKQPGFCWE